MKLAIITPPQGMHLLTTMGLGYHLVLAQKLLESPLYRERVRSELSNRGGYVIVDNGAAEHDTPPFNEVIDVANYIGADEIVLPDVVNDKDATLEALFSTASWERVAPRRRFIVPQGRTKAEWFECLEQMLAGMHGHESVAAIGISKYHPTSRLDILNELSTGKYAALRNHAHIHILGLQTNDPISEVRAFARHRRAPRGLDTGAPAAWAQNGKALTQSTRRYSLNWNDENLYEHEELLQHNMLDLLWAAAPL